MNESKGHLKNIENKLDGLDLSIVLINVESSGNVGSIARVMKNFGFHKLILINPKEDPKSNCAHGFAMHAQDILDIAEVISIDNQDEYGALEKFFEQFYLVI